MVLFIMLHKVVLAFRSLDQILLWAMKMKAAERCFDLVHL